MSVEISSTITILGTYFLFILLIIGVIYIKEKGISSKLNAFDFEKFLPSDEIHYLKQIFLLAMSALFIYGFFAAVFIYDDLFDVSLLAIILATIAIVYIAEKDYISIILSLFVMPAPVVLWFFNITIIPLLIIHYIGIFLCAIYFIYNFLKFTKSNNLGFTVIIFILILIISCFITSYFEQTTLIDSIVMISNAFTSNGYTVLGHSTVSKIDSILLVWGGYLLSGVGTATLAAAIVTTYLKSRMKAQDEKIDNLTNEIKELKELMKK